MSKYAGAGWVAQSLKAELSPLGVNAANILGDAWAGIYHIDGKALHKVKWSDPQMIEVTVWGALSTFDNDRLTVLVLGCHERAVRMEIRGCGPSYTRLTFWQRKPGGNDQFAEHPGIDDAVARYRKHFTTAQEPGS